MPTPSNPILNSKIGTLVGTMHSIFHFGFPSVHLYHQNLTLKWKVMAKGIGPVFHEDIVFIHNDLIFMTDEEIIQRVQSLFDRWYANLPDQYKATLKKNR